MDEADRILNMDFETEVRRYIKKGEERESREREGVERRTGREFRRSGRGVKRRRGRSQEKEW